MIEKVIYILLLSFVISSINGQDSIQYNDVISFDTETEYQKGLAAISAFQYDKAAVHFYECQRNDPDNLEYLSKLAWCYLQAGNYSESKIYFKSILNKDPQHIVAISNLGYLFEKELNHQEAKKYYTQLIQIDSTNSYYFRLNAFNALNLAQPLQSLVYFNKAHMLNDKDLVVINELAKAYLHLEAYEYAESVANKGLELAEENLQLIYTSARIQNKKKSFENVITLLEKAQVLGDTNDYYQTLLGVSYLKIDSLDKGIEQLEQVILKEKETEHTHHYLSIGYDAKGNQAKSIYHLEKAIELGISTKVNTYYEELAAHHDRMKDYKKALEYYEEAYTHSGDPIYLFYIARNTDLFYKDKRMALRQYQKYLATGHKKQADYSRERVTQLKEIIHQSRK